MTREDQDKRWNDLSEIDKAHYREQYKESSTIPESGVPKLLEELFGRHNLLPQLTYEDVAKELFKDGVWQFRTSYFIEGDSNADFRKEASSTSPLNLTSERQAEKLLAINKLLNVAKYLNKNEDDTDLVPDRQDGMWAVGINRYTDEIAPIETSMYDYGTEIVYFRTRDLAKQAIEILGEDVIRTALGNY